MKRLFKGFVMSLYMFSTIPMPMIWEDKALSLIIPILPIVGAIIGVLWFLFANLLIFIHAPLVISTVLVMLFPLFLSGFIHIDGYMDTSDAIFSRAPLEKKRIILKDSHVGAFAVIALCVYLMLWVAGGFTILQSKVSLLPLVFIPMLSRSIASIFLLNCKSISPTGFASTFKENTKPIHTVFLSIFVVLILVLGPLMGGLILLYVLLGLAATGVLTALYVTKQLEGISGDLCGYIISISEVVALIIWAIMV